MQKKLSTLVLATATTVALTLPSSAQGFNPGQFFSSAKERLSNGAQRLYLRAVPGKKPGKLVIKQSFEAMENVTSFDFDVTADADVKKGDETLGTGSFTIKGPVTVQDVYDPKTAQQQLAVSGQVQVEGVTISGAGDMIIDGQKALYLRLTEIPLPIQQYRDLKNQWMMFDLSKQTQEVEQPEMTAEMQKKYEDAVRKLYENATVSDARKEKWNGKSVFVVDAQFSDDSIISYIDEVSQISAEASKATESALTTKDKEEIKEVLGAIEDFKMTARVDRSNFYLRQAEMPLVFDFTKIQEAMQKSQTTRTTQADPTAPDTMTVNLKMSFDNYNKPVTITIPSDAKPAEEVMQSLGGSALVAPQGSTRQMPSSTYPGYGYGYGSGAQELPTLTPEQQRMLEQQYGY